MITNALNFQWSQHLTLLLTRKKTCTVRLGDIRDSYPENALVRITFGKPFMPKRALYPAMIDKVYVKKISELTSQDLDRQNPYVKSPDELLKMFEAMHEKSICLDDTVTVIYFSELTGD